jgi:hypothetical protein
MQKLPHPSKIIDFLREATGARSVSEIRQKFYRCEAQQLSQMLRKMAANGDLMRSHDKDRAMYSIAPSASGLESIQLWKIKLPKATSSRIVAES